MTVLDFDDLDFDWLEDECASIEGLGNLADEELAPYELLGG